MAGYMQKSIRLVIFSTLAAAMFFSAGAIVWRVLAQDSVVNPHELQDGAGRTTCTNCHQQMPEGVPENTTRVVLPKAKDFKTGPVAMCISCHEGSEESHPLGVNPKYPVPADLPLDKEGGISCCTCHYTHGSLKSDHPCCSVSVIDRMFGSDRLKKSFLLRRENRRGELCRACHGTTDRKEEKEL